MLYTFSYNREKLKKENMAKEAQSRSEPTDLPFKSMFSWMFYRLLISSLTSKMIFAKTFIDNVLRSTQKCQTKPLPE